MNKYKLKIPSVIIFLVVFSACNLNIGKTEKQPKVKDEKYHQKIKQTSNDATFLRAQFSGCKAHQ